MVAIHMVDSDGLRCLPGLNYLCRGFVSLRSPEKHDRSSLRDK